MPFRPKGAGDQTTMNTRFSQTLPTRPLLRFALGALVLARASFSLAQTEAPRGAPSAPPLPPTAETRAAEAQRKAVEDATVAEMARLRAARPKTSGLLPPPARNAAGDPLPVRPPPRSLAEVEEQRAERAARIEVPAEELAARLEDPARLPAMVRNAAPDDPRFVRARLAKAEAEARSAPAGRPPVAGAPTPLEDLTAARAEIVRRTGLTGRLPPAPTGPPPGAVVAPMPEAAKAPPVRAPSPR